MEPREIPGFYYDPDKKKYFKVDKKAPATAAYSTESVKRRKLEHEQARKALLIEGHKKKQVRKSSSLQDPLLGGLLARELGNPRKDLLVDCWARGLCQKGSVLLRRQAPAQASAGHLYIGTADESRQLGVAIGVDDVLYGTFLPRDENGIIVQDPTMPFWMQEGRELAEVRQISSLKYHKPSNQILITSRTPGDTGGLYYLSFDSRGAQVATPDATSPPGWDLRRPYLRHLHSCSRQGRARVANTCVPAPPTNSNLICVVGTNRGLGCYSSSGQMLWLENPSSKPPRPRAGPPPPASDVLSVDFLPRNPQTLIAGLRGSRKICLADLRQSAREWEWMAHGSSPAHVRCLSEHRVLAAGPNHSMSIYDLRFRHREHHKNIPIVTFPEYQNAEQIHFALDVDISLGVVATSASHGTVAGGNNRRTMSVFSLETGKRLEVPALCGDVAPARPPGAIVFHTLAGETTASLFVSGPARSVLKYSFGGNLDEWTGERFHPPTSGRSMLSSR